MQQPRRHAGVPTGGQWIAKTNPEADFELDWIPGDEDLVLPEDSSLQVVAVDPEPAPIPDPPVDPPPDPPVTSDPAPSVADELGLAEARATVEALMAELTTPTSGSARLTELVAAAEGAVTDIGRRLSERVDLIARDMEQDGVPSYESRQRATVAVLAQCRDLGLPPGEALPLAASTQRPAAAVLNQAATRFPRAWLSAPAAASRPPLTARVGTGRCHYSPSRGKWEKTGAEEYPSRYEAFPASAVPKNAIDVEYTADGRANWTVIRKAPVKVLSIVSEITVPSPKRNAVYAEQVATHELMHRLEDTNNHIPILERAFLARRCVDEHGHPTPTRPYLRSRTERVQEGGFVDPYVGKVYNRTFTEVLSIGTEAVFTGTYGGLTGAGDHKADPDHRAFVLGMLAVA